MSNQFQQSPSPRDVGFNLFDRRGLLARGAGAALAGSALAGMGAESAFGASKGTVTFGSNYSDPVPKAAIQSVMDKSGLDVTINTVDHGTFQEQIDNYLQGTPDDAFT